MSSARARILLVEDHSDSLRAFASLIRTSGHIVYTADGYQTALEVAKRERIDLAVCDIALWDGEGCDLLKELQKVQPLKAIAMTGFSLSDEVERYRAAGFLMVLPKPLKPSLVKSAISEVLDASSINGEKLESSDE